MIDTKFAAQPSRVSLPLYPTLGDKLKPTLSSKKCLDLFAFLQSYYEVERNQLFLGGRACSVLHLFLKHLAKNHSQKIRIGLPAFCCSEVCHTIQQAGAVPVFLDLDENLQIDKQSILFAKAQSCSVVLFPLLYGADFIYTDLIQFIHNLGMILIIDEAQHFPTIPQKNWNGDVHLFSFGVSKKLASPQGGGGICIKNQDLAKNFFPENSLKTNPLTPLVSQVNRLKQNLSWNNRKVAKFFRFIPPLENDLKLLLEKKPYVEELHKLSTFQKLQAELYLSKYLESLDLFKDLYRSLKEKIRCLIGEEALYFMKAIQNPTMLGLSIPSNERLKMMNYLSEWGIQTTWYYYPLNQLSFFSDYPSEPTTKTIDISSKVVILPFQWSHKQSDIDHLVFAIEQWSNEK